MIELNSEQNCCRHLAVDEDKEARYTTKYGAATSGGEDADDKIPVTDYNPSRSYVEELKNCYGDKALFFHDKYGGDAIGVLFKPSVKQAQKFKVTAVSALHPVALETSAEPQMMLNIPAILEDFRSIGEGLVSNIKTNQQ